MDNNNGISSLAEYMAWVEGGTQKAKEQGNDTLLYRGHSDAEYKFIPTVYRKNSAGESFRAVEHHLFEDMLRRDHTTFANDKTMFEKLVRMQHYGLPTRLLDLTHSPLIALYFACEDERDISGEVLLFQQNNAQVWFPADVPDVAFAGIASACSFEKLGIEGIRLFQNFLNDQKEFTTAHEAFNNSYQYLLDSCINKLEKAKNEKDLLKQVIAIQHVEKDLLENFIKQWDLTLTSQPNEDLAEQLKTTNTNVALLKFQNRLAEYIEAIITRLGKVLRLNEVGGGKSELSKFLQQFTFFYFALPPINNERIRRQQGAFVICPPGKTDLWDLAQYIIPDRILIKGSAKTKILAELASLGMTRSYVYPEAAEIAKDVQRRYPATLD